MLAQRTPYKKKLEFPVQCVWLKINGSWPLYDINSFYGKFYQNWSVFVIMLVGATCAFQVWYMVDNFGDILKVTENCCTSLMGIHTFLRLIHMRMKRNEMRQLIKHFFEKIYVTRGIDDKIEKETHRDLLIYRMMSLMLFALICMYCILPLVELFSDSEIVEKPFPYKMVFPYNAQQRIFYLITYAYTSFAGFVAVTTLLSEDSFFGFLLTHTCGQFQILHKSIKQIIPNENNCSLNERSLQKQLVEHEYNLQLKGIVQQHNILIDFCCELDNFCSPYLLVNFFISSVLICVVGFQLFTVRMSLGDSSKFCLYIVSALSQLFIICGSGDKLIGNSTKTALELYTCNWERYYHGCTNNVNNNIIMPFVSEQYHPPDIRFLKNLAFAMLRAQKPLRITALKFSVLSLQNFAKILSTSMSYFTLLQTVYEKE